MKKTGFFAGLSKSTRMTVIGCACFLVMSAAIVGFLMFCPIEPKSRTMEVRPASDSAVSEAETSPQGTEEDSRRQERSTEKHPLSTWGVTFDHSTFNRDDYDMPERNDDETVDMEDLPMGEDPTEPPQENTGGEAPTEEWTDSGNVDTDYETDPLVTDEATQGGPIATDPPEPPPATDPPIEPDPTAAPLDSAAGSV